MIGWLKNLFSNPKVLIKMAIDALDFSAPLLAKEIDKTKERFNRMTSAEQAQFAIDWVQEHLRTLFKIDADA